MTGISHIGPATASAFETNKSLQGRKNGGVQFALPPIDGSTHGGLTPAPASLAKGNALTGPLISKLTRGITA